MHHLLAYFDHFVCQLMHNAVGNNDSMFSSAAFSTAVTNECKSKYCPPERRLILFLKRSDGSSPQANSHLSLVSPSVIDSLSSEFQSYHFVHNFARNVYFGDLMIPCMLIMLMDK